MRLFVVISVMLATSVLTCAGTVTVSLTSANPSFTTGEEFAVGLFADLPDPVLGFGIDMNFDPTLLMLDSFTVGPLWFPAAGAEANDFAGLAFPIPVSGPGTLLGTFNFTALNTGSSMLTLAYDSTNFAEGFPLVTGGFAPNNLPDESAVPEPSALMTVGFGLLIISSKGLERIGSIFKSKSTPRVHLISFCPRSSPHVVGARLRRSFSGDLELRRGL